MLPGVSAVPAVVGSMRLTPYADRVRARIPLSHRVPFRVDESEHGRSRSASTARRGDVELDALRARPIRWFAAWPGPRTGRDEVTARLRARASRSGAIAPAGSGATCCSTSGGLRIDAGDSAQGPADRGGPRPSAGRRHRAHRPAGGGGQPRRRPRGPAAARGRRGAKVLHDPDRRRRRGSLAPGRMLAERRAPTCSSPSTTTRCPTGSTRSSNNGTSVYYNQPRSVPLARAIQAALVRRLGLRDLGFGRGDLALVRATWMPSVLTEGLFMMLPDQEAALRSPEGQRLYAQAVVDGLRRFLRERDARVVALPRCGPAGPARASPVPNPTSRRASDGRMRMLQMQPPARVRVLPPCPPPDSPHEDPADRLTAARAWRRWRSR